MLECIIQGVFINKKNLYYSHFFHQRAQSKYIVLKSIPVNTLLQKIINIADGLGIGFQKGKFFINY